MSYPTGLTLETEGYLNLNYKELKHAHQSLGLTCQTSVSMALGDLEPLSQWKLPMVSLGQTRACALCFTTAKSAQDLI